MNNNYELKKQLIKELSDLGREAAELKNLSSESTSLNSVSAKLLDHINNIKDIADKNLNNGVLRAGEEKYKALFESANDAIFLMQDDKFIDCNAKALEMFRCTRDQIIGFSPYNFSPEFQANGHDSKSLALEKINAALAGKIQFFEWRHKRLDGALFDVEVSLTKFGYNSKSYILAIVRDITRRKQGIQALHERENQIKGIFRTAPVAIGMFIDHRIHEVNDKACEMTGYSSDELIGQITRFLYLSQADYDYVSQESSKLIEMYGIATIETRWRRKDDKIINVLLSSTPYDTEDSSSGFVTTVLDITERKRAEAALQESNERFRKIFMEGPLGMVTVNAEYRFSAVNDSFCRMTGYSEQELLTLTFKDITHPDNLTQDTESIRKLERGEIPIYRTEKRYVRKDGKLIWGALTTCIVRDADGRFLYFLSMIDDITKDKQAEEALIEEKDKAQKYLDIAGVMFVALDKDGMVTLINKKGCQILGYEENEIIGKNWFDNFVPESYRKTIRTVYEKLMAGELNGSEYYENPILNKQGRERLIAWHNAKLTDDSGVIIGTVSSGEDITDRQKAIDDLRLSEERWKSLVENAPNYITIIDKQHKIKFINNSVPGLMKEDVIGKDVYDYISHEYHAIAREKCTSVFKNAKSEFYLSAAAGPHGVITWYENYLGPIIINNQVEAVTIIGIDITKKKLAEEALEKSLEEISALNNIGRLAGSSLSLDNVIDRTLKEAYKITNSDLVIYFLKDGENLNLKNFYYEDQKHAHRQTPTHKIGECLCGLAAKDVKAVYSKDIYKDPRCSWDECKKANLRSFAAIPLQAEGNIIGVLGIASAEITDFSARSVFLETMANYIAAGINNAILHGQQKIYAIELEKRVIERERAEDALKQAFAEIESLKNRLQAENVYLQDEIKLEHNFNEIITNNSNFKKILSKVEQVAATDATVLILGETGTGKELIARAVHNISPRRNRPLVKLNCAALPPSLIESELFGHEKGAFTGAVSQKIGRFELADGGTIFLDEIGDLPLDLQTKLLRVLQEGEFERVGGRKTIKVDVRVLAATNRNLRDNVKDGTFREDLYYRLNVFPIVCPPLNERKDDIPLLVNHFVKKSCKKIGKNITFIPKNVMDAFLNYDWPGNVRELENIIERAVITSSPDRLELTGELIKQDIHIGSTSIAPLEEYERDYIIKVLEKVNWRVSGEKGAAKLLGLNPKTLESRMRKLNIRRNN